VPHPILREPAPRIEDHERPAAHPEALEVVDGVVNAFGDVAVRSPEAFARLERLATLNQKELAEGLSPAEKKEQTKLRNMLPTAASEVSEDDE